MSPDANRRKTPEELRQEIEATRAEMQGTVDLIQQRVGEGIGTVRERLQPRYYTSRLRDSMLTWRDSGMRALRDTTNSTARKVDDMAHTAGERAGDLGSNLVNLVREHPVPVALIGAGIGLLAAGSARAAAEGRGHPYRVRASSVIGSDYEGTIGTADNPPELPRSTGQYAGRGAGERMRERASHMRESASHMGERISHLGGDVRHAATDTTQGLGDFIRDNPLAAGAVATMAGVLIGLLIPGTPYEDRWMGEARDRVMDRAKEAAGEAREVAGKSLQEAADTVRDEAQKHGLSGQQVKEDVKDVAQEATKTAKDTAKNAMEQKKRENETRNQT